MFVGALLLAGCGDVVDGETSPAAESPTATEEPTAEEPTAEEPTEDPTTADEPASPQEPTDDGDLPGEAVEIHPYQGGGLAVIGVAAEDVLHLRSGPGIDSTSLAELSPLTMDIHATGHNRQVDDGSFWAQIDVEGVTGWASPTYLAYPGQVTDITSEIPELPAAPDAQSAAMLIADGLLSGHPPSARAVVVDRPPPGDLHEIVLDVVGYGDDSLTGERLHIFLDRDGDSFTVRTVEATLLCSRGVSDGLCL